MKVKKALLKVSAMALAFVGLITITTTSQASISTSGKLLKMENPTYRASGYAYNAGLKSDTKTKEQHMWKIYEYNANGQTIKNKNNGIYCLKMGVGFGSENGSPTESRTYTIYADMKNPIESDKSIIYSYKESLPSVKAENYNSIVWILDNCYVPAPSESPTDEQIATAAAFRKELLTNAGIPNSKINDDLIDIIQQIAIWYFTNDDEYKANKITNIEAKIASALNYTSIEDVFDNWDLVENDANPDGLGDIYMLYNYFINGGKANKNTNPSVSDTNPIKLVSTGAKATLNEGNYIAGPYKIEELSDKAYTLEGSLIVDNEKITYTLLDENKNETTKTLEELIGKEFYLKVPSNGTNIEKAKFEVSTTVMQNTITYWTVANSNNDQPLAEVVPEKKVYKTNTTLSLSDFDLALRKFITKINNVAVTPSREPVVTAETIAALKAETIKTVEKTHTKTPLEVAIGDTVLYTIRIYNEGEVSGYAKEITDYLPAGLTLKENSTINKEYGWTNPSKDGKTIVTTKLANTLLAKFDGSKVAYADVEVECIVNASVSQNEQRLKNIAEITKDADENNMEITDRDSVPENLTDDQKKNYNPGTSTKGWGYEDDDDYEELVIPGKEFDLALRKFITKINNVAVTPSREPVVTAETIAALKAETIKTVEKTHTKTPLEVAIGDTVLYTIRIYNEGEVSGYAKEITDYLPAGLTLKENSTINKEYGWTNPSKDGKTIVTTKLANTLLAKFDGSKVAYADVEVECIVNASVSQNEQRLKNIAEITKDADENNMEITDRDSVPENLTDDQKKNYNPGTSTKGWGYEDDDDYEELIIPGKCFDLALRKFITNIEGKELVKENGTYLREPTIDLTPLKDKTDTTAIYKHPKDPIGVSIGDVVIYTLRVYNEGEIDGYANSVTDYLPPQLEFINDEFNAKYGWEFDSTYRVITSKFLSKEYDEEENLIKAFDGETLDYKELKIKCRVKSTENLKEVITNIAEITDFKDLNGNTVTDRDSQKANVVLPSDSDLPNYKGNESNKSVLSDKDYFYKGQQDDDDFEKLILEEFDLALRKFITGVNDKEVTNRVPVFTHVKDENGNYIYEHTKEPIEVESLDIVEYTIRVYNEGDISGYAKEVKDNIPEGLEFIPDNNTNKEYRWVMLDEDGNETDDVTKAKYITTDYLSKEQEKTLGGNVIKAFDSSKTSPDYKDVKVAFKVIALDTYSGIITNIAEISDDSDEEGNEVEDRDSTPDNDNEKEDDIDVEHIKLSYFDLALRKFITKVNDKELRDETGRYLREPLVNLVIEGNEKTIQYSHTKEPVDVLNGDIVTYTLRIYNEGTKDGYAKEVKDDLPEGLEFLPENETNKEYRWVMLDENGEVTEDITKAKSIKTDYLSKEQEDEAGRNNLLKAYHGYDAEEEGEAKPDFRDLKIAFKVTEPNTSDRILINKAQISDDSDKDGNEVIDKDSTPDKWIEGEDDQDIEKVKVKYFDLALRKWVTQAIVIDNGKETVHETGHKAEDDPEEVVKVEIKESRLNKVVVKFRYKIRVTNEGEIPGYVKEVSDYIPEGLKFVAADNPNWKEVEGKVVTDQLKDTLLKPGESAEVEILLTWINGKNNFGLKVNVAEISKDYNESNTPDIDSTPDNKKEGEDDIDDAPVILTIKTGTIFDIKYITLITMSLSILASGVIFIKKYVL